MLIAPLIIPHYNIIQISDQDQIKYLLGLMNTLESLDDVQSVTANFELVENK